MISFSDQSNDRPFDIAVVVGIEAYEEHDWNVRSPAHNALRVVDWLLKLNVRPEEINLFVRRIETTESKYRGVAVHDTSYQTIDTFIRDALKKRCRAGTRLLVYWSGHGAMNANEDRIAFCSDYSSDCYNRAINLTQMFRSSFLERADRIIGLLDVCGLHNEEVEPSGYKLGESSTNRKQLIIYASRKGRYATGTDQIGRFTSEVLHRLNSCAPGSSIDDFQETLKAFEPSADLSTYSVTVLDDAGQRVFGGAPRHNWTKHGLSSLIESLEGQAVNIEVFRRHFRATLHQLGNVDLNNVADVPGMITALAQWGVDLEKPPDGLVQFLLRLCMDLGSLSDVLNPWLNEWSTAIAVKTIRDELEDEAAPKYLVLKVEADRSGSFSALQPYLRTKMCRSVRADGLKRTLIRTWAELESAIQGFIGQLETLSLSDKLEVHIVAEAVLYDWPFHQLRLPNGRFLGEQYVVLLHFPERQTSVYARNICDSKAAVLISQSPSEIRWSSLTAASKHPDECCIWWVGDHLNRDVDRSAEKKRLHALLRVGAPFVYWSHTPSCEANASRFRDEVARLSDLQGVPRKLLAHRIFGSEFAKDGALLWDEPTFKPFSTIESFDADESLDDI